MLFENYYYICELIAFLAFALLWNNSTKILTITL